tara:strand:- start:870 stop:995 length:126 start_codon:yes stop_codon:yes gene_type:complete
MLVCKKSRRDIIKLPHMQDIEFVKIKKNPHHNLGAGFYYFV